MHSGKDTKSTPQQASSNNANKNLGKAATQNQDQNNSLLENKKRVREGDFLDRDVEDDNQIRTQIKSASTCATVSASILNTPYLQQVQPNDTKCTKKTIYFSNVNRHVKKLSG